MYGDAEAMPALATRQSTLPCRVSVSAIADATEASSVVSQATADALIPFFGRPAPFPLGPFLLARAVGVPLVPAFCVLDLDGRYTVKVVHPIVVRRGANVEIAYYDQQREQLDPDETVFATIGNGNDTVTVNGRVRHVNAYLRDFLFDPAQAASPVKALSGVASAPPQMTLYEAAEITL